MQLGPPSIEEIGQLEIGLYEKKKKQKVGLHERNKSSHRVAPIPVEATLDEEDYSM